jgi:hypothetical protein
VTNVRGGDGQIVRINIGGQQLEQMGYGPSRDSR